MIVLIASELTILCNNKGESIEANQDPGVKSTFMPRVQELTPNNSYLEVEKKNDLLDGIEALPFRLRMELNLNRVTHNCIF